MRSMNSLRLTMMVLLPLFAACGHHDSVTPGGDPVNGLGIGQSVCINPESRRECLVEWASQNNRRTVVRATIESDGTISSSSIEEGSRNSSIDQQALEIVRKAAPFKNPLGRRVIALIPITILEAQTK